MSEFHDAEEISNTEVTSDCKPRTMTSSPAATFHNHEIHCEDNVYEISVPPQSLKPSKSHLEAEPSCPEEVKPDELWQADVGYRSDNDINNAENSACTVPAELKSSIETSNLSNDGCEQAMSDHDLELPLPVLTRNIDHSSKLLCNPSNIPCSLVNEDTNASASDCLCDERNDLQFSCGGEFETIDSIDYVVVKSQKSFVTCSSSSSIEHSTKLSTDYVKETNICDVKILDKDNCDKFVINRLECYSPEGNHFDQNSGIDTEESSDNSTNNAGTTIQRYLSSDSSENHCPSAIYSEGVYHSFSTTQNVQAEDSYLSSDTRNSQSELTTQHLQMSQSVDCYETPLISEMCNTVCDSKCFSRAEDITDNVSKELGYSTEAAAETSHSVNQISPEESGYKQSLEEYKLTEGHQYKHLSASRTESSYKQTVQTEDSVLRYTQTTCKKDVSSYKQHPTEDVEEMDTETLDEDDIPCISVSPSIYQSYEDASMAALHQTSAMADLVNISQYETSDSHAGDWNPASSSDDSVSTSLANSQIPNSETFTTTQNTVTVAATSSTKDQAIASASTSSRRAGPVCEEDHKAVLCTGDQTFKSAVIRQSTAVPYMPVGCSLSYVSGINPSMYAGAPVVQGLGGPTVMTSSSVHIAQHPGGATIMQHQSMRSGMAQTTVMQQQAMSHGMQAAAMMQHRTLTSGGQTMMVQQRTMTTGLGGLAQQTVVQQRVAAPGSIAQAAMFHANAMRHRTLAAQQASIMQHRSIRLVPTRMMGSPMFQQQTVGNTLIRGGPANHAPLMGHGLVRGMNQGAIMQHLVGQRYLGGPIMSGRGMQVVAGPHVRLVNK